ncbi:MAG: type II secretion system protein GspG [Planctomycetota bacterium]
MEVTAERRPLSTRAKVTVAAGALVATALVAATTVYLIERVEYRTKLATTRKQLENVQRGWPHPRETLRGRPRVEGENWGVFPIKIVNKAAQTLDGPVVFEQGWAVAPFSGSRGDFMLDAWGHMVKYVRPGPVHRNGWDLYSVGPDGIDEHGQGDDILVGEDVAPIGSGRR